MSSETAYTSDTLRILHLPSQLSDGRRNELFQKYGAIKTRTIRVSKKYTITFAKFPSKEMAMEALLHLHQLNVKGQYLTVEFAKKSISLDKTEYENNNEKSTDKELKKESTNKIHFQSFLQKLNSWTMHQNFTQPPPPNIRYKYLPPTRGTLIRIAIQLLKEPAFYTQVLHLMNRMNLPPPFEELDDEFPMLKEVYDMEKYKDIFGKEIVQEKYDSCDEEMEDEESEIESDQERSNNPLEIIPVKRKRPQSMKRMKIPKFVNPAKQVASTSTQKVLKPEDMFEQVQRGETKNLRIELKTVDKLLDATTRIENINPESTADGGFGLMFPSIKNVEESETDKDSKHAEQDVIASEDLVNNRISANDQRLLPVFKNYHPGKPSNRLYIKNLAKQVEMKDLNYIYQKYVIPDLQDAEFEYSVRLMQEGRMKGQAFVTFQNVKQAQLALDETNGYILKDKPMVVQFAKATKT